MFHSFAIMILFKNEGNFSLSFHLYIYAVFDFGYLIVTSHTFIYCSFFKDYIQVFMSLTLSLYIRVVWHLFLQSPGNVI